MLDVVRSVEHLAGAGAEALRASSTTPTPPPPGPAADSSSAPKTTTIVMSKHTLVPQQGSSSFPASSSSTTLPATAAASNSPTAVSYDNANNVESFVSSDGEEFADGTRVDWLTLLSRIAKAFLFCFTTPLPSSVLLCSRELKLWFGRGQRNGYLSFFLFFFFLLSSLLYLSSFLSSLLYLSSFLSFFLLFINLKKMPVIYFSLCCSLRYLKSGEPQGMIAFDKDCFLNFSSFPLFLQIRAGPLSLSLVTSCAALRRSSTEIKSFCDLSCSILVTVWMGSVSFFFSLFTTRLLATSSIVLNLDSLWTGAEFWKAFGVRVVGAL